MINISYLKKRAYYLSRIREFFALKNILEVDTPLAYSCPVTDPNIDNFKIKTQSGILYLQGSPEYAMKRLLASGSGSIYQICKAFRDDPKEVIHNHEFNMLEWYSIGINHFGLMHEIMHLINFLKPEISIQYISYRSLFEKYYGFNPHNAKLKNLINLIQKNIGSITGIEYFNLADALDILFSSLIEKKLSKNNVLYIVYHYHQSQSALAKTIYYGGDFVAGRFELFMCGIEIGNGYDELNNKTELLLRFNEDLKIRKKNNKTLVPIDYSLLECIDKIPDCSGVAIGLDRLLMAFESIKSFEEFRLE